jgi:hypothetical protein
MLYVSGGRLLAPLSAALLADCAGNGAGRERKPVLAAAAMRRLAWAQ